MDGVAPYWQGIVFDITERKHAEGLILQSERHEREAAERLRALDQMKNSFLTAVSNELRRPLTTILGMALTLERQEAFDEERASLWNKLRSDARKLDRLLRDLLDVDRVSRGIVVFNPRETDLGALARSCVESLDVGARTVVVDESPVAIQVDAPKVERIVEDLVTGALRHTGPDARIWVRVLPESDGAVIAVEHDGPGVPLEERDSIFESFRQGPELSGQSAAASIGLSLVKMFAEMHGGRAWVQDREGGGASFRVFFPFALLDEVSPSGELAHPDLLAEDVPA
jgi:signal transduction histidine kinase